jgi:hypothetical protein
MGLFTFIKKLIGAANNLEAQVDTFVAEVKEKAPQVAAQVEPAIKKAKAVKKEVVAKTIVVEKKVTKSTPAKKTK